jgi:hypothetical protein
MTDQPTAARAAWRRRCAQEVRRAEQQFVVGETVRGLGRGDRRWIPEPLGTVTDLPARNCVRVRWHGTVVEDDMEPQELRHAD